MKRVMIYMDEMMFRREGDSTTYLYEGFLEHPRDFEADISFEPDPNRARESDIVFCRFEIPIKRQFLESLIVIEREGGRLFVNSPMAKLYESSKRNLRHFIGEKWLPKTRVTDNPYDAAEFIRSLEGRLVTKPTDLNGGKGVEIHDAGMSYGQAYDLATRITSDGAQMYVFQEFVEGVENLGDKRVNVFLYEPVNAILRLPKNGSRICNISAGGTMQKTEITPQDMTIIDGIRPVLQSLGITWAGVDIIGPYLTELNVSSPGALIEADQANQNTCGRDRTIELLKNHRIG